ncbi:MAG TPA: hypothetical protein VLB80_01270 [Candidatus Babeliales bacterium]|nr:hypothetical protein [Candidatus Babeliales bacterium]
MKRFFLRYIFVLFVLIGSNNCYLAELKDSSFSELNFDIRKLIYDEIRKKTGQYNGLQEIYRLKSISKWYLKDIDNYLNKELSMEILWDPVIYIFEYIPWKGPLNYATGHNAYIKPKLPLPYTSITLPFYAINNTLKYPIDLQQEKIQSVVISGGGAFPRIMIDEATERPFGAIDLSELNKIKSGDTIFVYLEKRSEKNDCKLYHIINFSIDTENRVGGRFFTYANNIGKFSHNLYDGIIFFNQYKEKNRESESYTDQFVEIYATGYRYLCTIPKKYKTLPSAGMISFYKSNIKRDYKQFFLILLDESIDNNDGKNLRLVKLNYKLKGMVDIFYKGLCILFIENIYINRYFIGLIGSVFGLFVFGLIGLYLVVPWPFL